LIPELPPKKLASDPLFLERRLKGLGRFLNQLMKHPVLSVEPLVVMFLTVPTDLSSWRKQAQYDSTEEYHDRKISQGFITLWDDTYLESWKSVESQINDSWERWMKLTVIIERIEIRTRQISQDNAKFTQLLDGFNESIQKVYQDGDIALISNNLANVSSSVDSHRGLLDDESQESHTVISEQFKQYGDILLAMRALFDRYKRHGGNSIDQLTRRLEANKARLQEMNGKPDVKGIDVDRINELIEKDTKEIEKQHNRDWLIKETILTEFIMFQETQYQITKVVQIWIGNKMKYSELYSNNWGKLLGSLHDMPSSRHS
jgi:sorting nexin-8